MNNTNLDSPHDARVERIKERLLQEREVFQQHKAHENRWFNLRLFMGYSSVIILAVIMVVSVYILFNYRDFSEVVVASAGAALFADTLGLGISIWKIVFKPDFTTKLVPVTELQPSDLELFDNPPSVSSDNSGGLIILSAKYGADKSWIDVTPLLRAKITDNKLRVTASNDELGTDPIKGVVKNLEVTYSYNGQTRSTKVGETATLFLPEVL